MQQKIKLVGQLIDDDKPTELIISDDIKEIEKTAKEYQKVFPDIFLNAEWGYFKTELSNAKKVALANLFGTLNAPLTNILKNLT